MSKYSLLIEKYKNQDIPNVEIIDENPSFNR